MNEQGNYEASNAGIVRALHVLSGVATKTPILPVDGPAGRFWLKPESLQPVGAFKLRGAYHRLAALSEKERAAGVVAFSSGNHAQGVAWAARKLGIRATIVMPADAPRAKRLATEALGGEVVPYDRATESRERIAAALAAERGAVLVPSFDDPWVIEGQGTIGLEAAGQMGRAPARVVVPCGGGGLAAGIALAIPGSEIVVVEPEGWDEMGRSLLSGAIVEVGPKPPTTRCDALQTIRVADRTFSVLQDAGARGVAVSEEEIEVAIRLAFDRLQLVAEAGGAVALAAMLAGKVDVVPETLVILSGGNIDPADFAEIIR
ncbi:threonine ammonia-lyase [Sphingomonas sp. ID0503]|uniref:threonine ammonia-lyase n=1 Tax=Sphingomonas sp. ID0503 TaxID=3399691 RepID=UPI003AFB7B76